MSENTRKRWYITRYELVDDAGEELASGDVKVHGPSHSAACQAAQATISLVARMAGYPFGTTVRSTTRRMSPPAVALHTVARWFRP